MKKNTVEGYQKVLDALREDIAWDETIDGGTFWSGIYQKLETEQDLASGREKVHTQHTITVGQKFRFVGDSIRAGTRSGRIFMKVSTSPALRDYPGRLTFLDPQTNDVFVFRAYDEALVLVEGDKPIEKEWTESDTFSEG